VLVKKQGIISGLRIPYTCCFFFASRNYEIIGLVGPIYANDVL
jgi:hypothetical protein